MRIGHIDLSRHISGAEEQLVILVESLTVHGVEQHVLVRNPFLGKRLSVCGGVTVAPTVRSSVAASFLMPDVDLVHTHDGNGIHAGMLLNLTRSIPYVITQHPSRMPRNNFLDRSAHRRAEGIIFPTEDMSNEMISTDSVCIVDIIADAGNPDDAIDAENGRISAEKMAAEYLRVYRRILDSRSVPGILL